VRSFQVAPLHTHNAAGGRPPSPLAGEGSADRRTVRGQAPPASKPWDARSLIPVLSQLPNAARGLGSKEIAATNPTASDRAAFQPHF